MDTSELRSAGDASTPSTSMRYMKMSAEANQIAKRYGFCAACCAWITLAGYVVLPSTFTSLKNASGLDSTAGGKIVQDAVENIEMLKLASALCCMGTVGNCFLWYRWRRNYIWLTSHIFQ
jgi:hypothetical protein